MRSAVSTWGSSFSSGREDCAARGRRVARLPAQHTHHDFGGESAVGDAEIVESVGMQEFAGVGVLLLDSQQDVESGGACRRDRHGSYAVAPSGSSLRGR